MTLTGTELIVIIAGGILSSLAVMGAGLRWAFRLVNALNDNTQANARLSKAFETFSARIDITLMDLEKRITVLETMIRGRRPWLSTMHVMSYG